MWARVFEEWLTQKLLRSPTFHRAVQNVHKRVQEIRHGKDPEEMGGTKIDGPEGKGLFGHFVDELKEQFKGGPPRK
ncbi:hypothetical protein MMC10_003158 [Thelotrema lepadinum]|nr:hypothetical protein [Thelotrema lepadinum]